VLIVAEAPRESARLAQEMGLSVEFSLAMVTMSPSYKPVSW